MDEQYKNTELRISCLNKELTLNFCAEKLRKVLLYAYCGNNPVNRIDPDGREWKIKDDEEYAKQLSQEMAKRKEELWTTAMKKLDQYRKATGNSNKEKAEKIKSEMQGIGADMKNMDDGISELTAMGETKDQIFTYNKVDGDKGDAGIEDGIIVMNISGNGSIANGIHESTHGYDLWKNGGNTKNNYLGREVKAYQRQFSYAQSSLPTSYIDNFTSIGSIGLITNDWVLGIRTSSGKYPYIDFKAQKNISDYTLYLNLLKKRK
ncbi:MAG: hypothetical protein LBG77_03870 [Dysgonamonadaceae bacterium]|nr:hypothetical protein [Dysgonamonadaceae bacterium]